MAKVLFRPNEIALKETKVFLEIPQNAAELSQDISEDTVEEEYQGPTIEELRQEAELFKTEWAAEQETMRLSAKLEVERIIREAEETADQERAQKLAEAEALKTAAQKEAAEIIANVQQQIQDMEAASTAAMQKQQQEAKEQGMLAGQEAGFKQGMAEAERLIQRVHTVLERAQNKRADILIETERQIIDLVLLMARKVIKIISESQREVIISNISEALRKVKGQGDIIIRVNTADLNLATEHIADFIQKLERVNAIQVQEDTTIDRGGCIIETEFGEIDARIASQLAELETKILEIAPIKTKPKLSRNDEV
jgi:flagellar assembly protein FliH